MTMKRKLDAASQSEPIETTVRAVIARQRREEIVASWLGDRLVRLLRFVRVRGEIPIEQRRGDTVADDGFHGRRTNPELALGMASGIEHGLGGDLRLENWR